MTLFQAGYLVGAIAYLVGSAVAIGLYSSREPLMEESVLLILCLLLAGMWPLASLGLITHFGWRALIRHRHKIKESAGAR